VQYAFEDYVLDPERRELTRGSDVIAVGPQVFDLLLYLVQSREHVVSKDELLDGVWNGRIVSESTLTSHINAVRKAVGDNGEEQRLIRTVHRKGFRFVGDVKQMPPGGSSAAVRTEAEESSKMPVEALILPDKPSIAVLPFLNLSGDAEQEYFAEGVVEDIIRALSRARWLFVMAHNSSFTYKSRAVDVKDVGRELGVRYVLEGSVRKAAHKWRITGQLIDATTGTHLWAERFEGSVEDGFELQDEVAASVAGAIAPELERAEIERAKRKPTESLNAYDCYLRGVADVHRGSRQAIDEALPMLNEAIGLDPNFASAYAMAAWCHFWRKVNGWMSDRVHEMNEGIYLAQRAVELGRNDAVALARGGHAIAHLVGDLDCGIAFVDRALALNPNMAAAWFVSGFLKVWHGEPEDAIDCFTRAMRFSPLDPEMYRMQAGMAAAHLFARRFDAALSWAEKAFRDLPSFLMVVGIIAASHALAGRVDQARGAMHHLRWLDPALRISNLTDWLPIRQPEHLATFVEGLRRAGLPE
jgi:TolB-like protein